MNIYIRNIYFTSIQESQFYDLGVIVAFPMETKP